MNGPDPTEPLRRELTKEINVKEAGREALEKEHGKVWNTDELRADFEVQGFMAPFVVVKRKADKKAGSLMFQHNPRFYFSFKED
jgi:hypothetical protein